jgi:hypothetical protein
MCRHTNNTFSCVLWSLPCCPALGKEEVWRLQVPVQDVFLVNVLQHQYSLCKPGTVGICREKIQARIERSECLRLGGGMKLKLGWAVGRTNAIFDPLPEAFGFALPETMSRNTFWPNGPTAGSSGNSLHLCRMQTWKQPGIVLLICLSDTGSQISSFAVVHQNAKPSRASNQQIVSARLYCLVLLWATCRAHTPSHQNKAATKGTSHFQ